MIYHLQNQKKIFDLSYYINFQTNQVNVCEEIHFKSGQIHLVNLALEGLFIPSITSWLAGLCSEAAGGAH